MAKVLNIYISQDDEDLFNKYCTKYGLRANQAAKRIILEKLYGEQENELKQGRIKITP